MVTADKTWRALTTTLRTMKGELTWLKNLPIKTICYLDYNGVKTIAHSSISQEDTDLNKHSSKIGRKAAIRNLMRALGPQTVIHDAGMEWERTGQIPAILPKDKRVEVARALKPQMSHGIRT